MPRIHGFPPIARADARILILGTMPSKASLAARQYYAHPMNLFWRIMGEMLDFDRDSLYETRAAALVASRVALWDVLASCRRKSSLDSDIDAASAVPNDFAGFFARHRRIRRVCFNGATAENLYLRHVRQLPGIPAKVEHVRLPSTSPANAGISYAEKKRAWRAAIASSA
jgi:double-stranded uracil-DNA glycosylase